MSNRNRPRLALLTGSVLIGAALAGTLACQSEGGGQSGDSAPPPAQTQTLDSSAPTDTVATPVAADDALKAPVTMPASSAESFSDFESNAFPPTLPPDEIHGNGWGKDDCLLCHETGNVGAPVVRHRGMAAVLLKAKCRTCHIVGPAKSELAEGAGHFAANAFPPTLPADDVHNGAWMKDECLTCHEAGIANAPKVEHAGMASVLLMARCRSCHVPSVASQEADVPQK